MAKLELEHHVRKVALQEILDKAGYIPISRAKFVDDELCIGEHHIRRKESLPKVRVITGTHERMRSQWIPSLLAATTSFSSRRLRFKRPRPRDLCLV